MTFGNVDTSAEVTLAANAPSLDREDDGRRRGEPRIGNFLLMEAIRSWIEYTIVLNHDQNLLMDS